MLLGGVWLDPQRPSYRLGCLHTDFWASLWGFWVQRARVWTKNQYFTNHLWPSGNSEADGKAPWAWAGLTPHSLVPAPISGSCLLSHRDVWDAIRKSNWRNENQLEPGDLWLTLSCVAFCHFDDFCPKASAVIWKWGGGRTEPWNLKDETMLNQRPSKGILEAF